MAEPVQLIELALADEHRLFSPFCFRVRLALCHKGLSFTRCGRRRGGALMTHFGAAEADWCSTEMHYADKPKIAPYDKVALPGLCAAPCARARLTSAAYAVACARVQGQAHE